MSTPSVVYVLSNVHMLSSRIPTKPRRDGGSEVDYFFFLRVHVVEAGEERIRCFPALLGRQQTVAEIVNLAATKVWMGLLSGV